MRKAGSVPGRAIDIVFLVRPALLCASCTFFFAGAASAAKLSAAAYSLDTAIKVLPNLALFMLVTSSAFVVNQILDVRSDAVNRKTFILPSGLVSMLESWIFLALLALSAVILSMQRGDLERYLVWVGLALGFLYSVPPVRLKAVPVGDLFANVAGFSLIGFALGWLALAEPCMELALRAIPYAVAMGAIFLNTCIPDEEGDRSAGDRTSCVAFGKEAVSRWALLLICGAAVLGAVIGEVPCTLAAAGSIPAFMAIAVDPTPQNSIVGSQFAARLLFILISIKAPVLAVLGLISFIAAKVYYSKRFGLDYPNLTGAEECRAPLPLR
jgi:4-hydroxybenzoate polyprenyltransferase